MVADRRVSKLIRPGRQEVNVVAMSHVLLCTWLADESSCLETAVSGDCWQDVASEYGNTVFRVLGRLRCRDEAYLELLSTS